MAWPVPDGYERTAEERDDARRDRERTAAATGRGEAPARADPPNQRVALARRPPPQRRRRGRPSRGRKWGGRLLAVLALALAGGVIWFMVELYQPFHGSPHGSVTVTIPPHSTSATVGDELARDGVISSGFFFDLRATLAGERGDLRAGTYDLQQDMTYSAVLKILTRRPTAAPVTNITIIEGRTRAQIDDAAQSAGRQGQLLRRDASLAADQLRRLRRAAAHAGPRGVPVPRHLPARRADQHPEARRPIS